jgi:hypothetical protein
MVKKRQNLYATIKHIDGLFLCRNTIEEVRTIQNENMHNLSIGGFLFIPPVIIQ